MSNLRPMGLVLLLLLFGPSRMLAQSIRDSTQTRDVLGYPTRILELGLDRRAPGEPVLVLFGGAASPLETWGEWPLEVSGKAPLIAYDRPGIGQSAYDSAGASPSHIVEHAHALLEELDAEPPYVLVGHSWGGPLVLYYAGRFPEDVAGLVYLDPTDPEETKCETVMASNESECATRFEELNSNAAERDLPLGLRAELDAIQTWQDMSIEQRAVPDAPDIPTATLLGTRVPARQASAPSFINEAFWRAYHARRVSRYADRMSRVSRGTLIVATDAGHFVHRSDPALATEAVRRVLEALRTP